jgi:hypothetical protein
MTIRPIALLTLAALLLPTVIHAQGPVAVPGTADGLRTDFGCCDDPSTCIPPVRYRCLVMAHQPDVRVLSKETDPGTFIGSFFMRKDDDGVTRWHVGVIGGPALSMSVEPSPAAQSRIRAEFAKKSTAPVVFDGGVMGVTGGSVSRGQ